MGTIGETLDPIRCSALSLGLRIVRLLEELAIEAIQSGRECIDKESLRIIPSLVPFISMEALAEKPSQIS